VSTLEALRRTVTTVEDLQSIVRTMKVLAAVSIRQYEAAVESLAEYNRTVEMGLHVVLREGQPEGGSRRRPPPRPAAVVFGSDHGLCGRFNEVVAAHAVAELSRLAPRAAHRVAVVGARAGAAVEGHGLRVEALFAAPRSAAAINHTVRDLLGQIDEWRSGDSVTDVLLCYNLHHAGAPYRPTMLHLLPVDTARLRSQWRGAWPSRVLPTFTMARPRLVAALVRQYLFVSLFRCCAESLASEHASRLLAMQIAEKNIHERLTELAMQLRRQRQEQITEELLDVVAGFEVLTGDAE
jgi:F-type H+-transporting ATPase subunit gamma